MLLLIRLKLLLMSEKSFFEKTGPYNLKILSDHINGKLSSIENSDILIDDISSLKNAKDREVTFFKPCIKRRFKTFFSWSLCNKRIKY